MTQPRDQEGQIAAPALHGDAAAQADAKNQQVQRGADQRAKKPSEKRPLRTDASRLCRENKRAPRRRARGLQPFFRKSRLMAVKPWVRSRRVLSENASAKRPPNCLPEWRYPERPRRSMRRSANRVPDPHSRRRLKDQVDGSRLPGRRLRAQQKRMRYGGWNVPSNESKFRAW